MMKRSESDTSTASSLKRLILTRGLRPGDPMPTEAELMEELGVSRSSIREAVRTLVALDILEVRHGTGTFVGQLSLRPLVDAMAFRGVLVPGENFSTLRDLVEVRAALDLALAPRIVDRLAGTDSAELDADLEGMRRCLARGVDFGEHDRAFHLHLAERLGNQMYGQLVAAFWDIHRTVMPFLGVASRREQDATLTAHEALLVAGFAGDLDAYRAATHDHYAPILRALDAHAVARRGASETVREGEAL